MDSKELINLYLDISEQIVNELEFDGSAKDKNNQYLFFSSLENSLDYLALDVESILHLETDSFHQLNYLAKWQKLSESLTIKNIINNEFGSNGLFTHIENVKEKISAPLNDSIIFTNEAINLKKINLILDKYKRFKMLLRKTLDEC